MNGATVPAWIKARAVRNMALGLCGCGRKRATLNHCRRCADRTAERQAAQREASLEQGMCGYCHLYPAVEGQTACARCVQTRAESRQRAKEQGACGECLAPKPCPNGCKEKKAARAKQRYADRRAAGLCQHCPAKAMPGKTTCKDCLTSAVEAKRQRRERRRTGAHP